TNEHSRGKRDEVTRPRRLGAAGGGRARLPFVDPSGGRSYRSSIRNDLGRGSHGAGLHSCRCRRSRRMGGCPLARRHISLVTPSSLEPARPPHLWELRRKLLLLLWLRILVACTRQEPGCLTSA